MKKMRWDRMREDLHSEKRGKRRKGGSKIKRHMEGGIIQNRSPALEDHDDAFVATQQVLESFPSIFILHFYLSYASFLSRNIFCSERTSQLYSSASQTSSEKTASWKNSKNSKELNGKKNARFQFYFEYFHFHFTDVKSLVMIGSLITNQ